MGSPGEEVPRLHAKVVAWLPTCITGSSVPCSHSSLTWAAPNGLSRLFPRRPLPGLQEKDG